MFSFHFGTNERAFLNEVSDLIVLTQSCPSEKEIFRRPISLKMTTWTTEGKLKFLFCIDEDICKGCEKEKNSTTQTADSATKICILIKPGAQKSWLNLTGSDRLTMSDSSCPARSTLNSIDTTRPKNVLIFGVF